MPPHVWRRWRKDKTMAMLPLKTVVRELPLKNPVVRHCVPLGYAPCIPLLSVKGGCLCLRVPFLRSQMTGEVDRTFIYPIRYALTLELPTLQTVGFANLEYEDVYGGVDFDRPISTFRHEAVRDFTQTEYRALVDELYGCYDKVAHHLIFGGPLEAGDEARMAQLLRILVDPKLAPFYRCLDRDFYRKYLEGGRTDAR